MPRVRCTVKLLSDKKRKVDIEIHKAKDGKGLWSLIKSAGGNLYLQAAAGTWETSAGDVLSLWEHDPSRKRQDLVLLLVWNIKRDFWDEIINQGKNTQHKCPLHRFAPHLQLLSLSILRQTLTIIKKILLCSFVHSTTFH